MRCCDVWVTCLVAAILLSAGSHCEADGDSTMVRVESIMNDLEFIEEQEDSRRSNADGSADPDLDIIDALLDNCEAILKRDATIPPDADYTGIVEESLTAWNRCTGIWNWYSALADWDFETNINDDTEKAMNDAQVKVSGYLSQLVQLAKGYIGDDRNTTLSDDYLRQLRLFAMGDTSKSERVQRLVASLQSAIENIYGKATVDGLAMEPDLTNLMATARDGPRLEKYWVGWRDATGALMKDKYAGFVENLNIGARENGYEDYGESWLDAQFDHVGDIKAVSERLWGEVEPLYQQLHAFVRTRLADTYPEYASIYNMGGIPAHLTGNMWAQSWVNIYDLVKPFKEVPEPDYDTAMLDKGFTVDGMFKLAEEFYTSLGLPKMTEKFNDLSMKVRPEGREVVCHASATDFYRDDDFRIKMCTEVNMEYLEVIHHEMGHIEYFMLYKDQPTVYRNGANSGFHEAIGDTIALSVMSRKHLAKIGLDVDSTATRDRNTPTNTKHTRGLTLDQKREINFLMKMALSKIAFLPFGYLIDKWRWDVFDGTTSEDEYNQHWWDLRLKYQGIISPVPRSEADFDPGAKFHIPSNSPYICYFISFMLQFQFYEAMCVKSGQLANSEPLHTCDFYQSMEAGTLLRDMMALGKSRPWNETLYTMTGSYEITSSSILKYFKPLTDWLTEYNEDTGTPIGWKGARVNWKSDSQFSPRKPKTRIKNPEVNAEHQQKQQKTRDNSKVREDSDQSDPVSVLISKLFKLLKN